MIEKLNLFKFLLRLNYNFSYSKNKILLYNSMIFDLKKLNSFLKFYFNNKIYF